MMPNGLHNCENPDCLLGSINYVGYAWKGHKYPYNYYLSNLNTLFPQLSNFCSLWFPSSGLKARSLRRTHLCGYRQINTSWVSWFEALRNSSVTTTRTMASVNSTNSRVIGTQPQILKPRHSHRVIRILIWSVTVRRWRKLWRQGWKKILVVNPYMS